MRYIEVGKCATNKRLRFKYTRLDATKFASRNSV